MIFLMIYLEQPKNEKLNQSRKRNDVYLWLKMGGNFPKKMQPIKMYEQKTNLDMESKKRKLQAPNIMWWNKIMVSK